MTGAMHYDFNNIDTHLDTLDGLTKQAQGLTEQLNAEMSVWTGYWQGDTQHQATDFTRNVHNTLNHTLDAATQYSAKARMQNEDMRAQEATNTALWA